MMEYKTFRKGEGEGGCGVIGIASSIKLQGKHLLNSLKQMRNRGNGKGGGIAAVGLSSKQFQVSQAILDEDYLLAIAYLDRNIRSEVERKFIEPLFIVDHVQAISPHKIQGVEILPPDVHVYFIRLKYPEKTPQEQDTLVHKNSIHLNQTYYASSGEKRAFVLSHGKNMLVMKMVGYGDDVIQCYQLENIEAHVWIGHHRYPTKGRVWHPGGAHPFVGLHEALVHNGDFANYHSICEYLVQRQISPLFLTDTEVAVLLFDLLHRTYQYPLEYIIEVLAPTTERDFTLLPIDKQHVYKYLQQTHMHGSPDGPWFFLIAQSITKQKKPFYRLIGITDTSMLRPQVFALQQGEQTVGLVASEKQAIDAALESLSQEDSRFSSTADLYWNARGGSYTDGGAFMFHVAPTEGEKATLTCTDKFGQEIKVSPCTKAKPFPTGQFLDATSYPPEGEHSLAREIVKRYQSGLKKIVIAHCKGQRFIGNGLGPNSQGCQIEVYGSSGDYLGSGIDGATVIVYGDAQDQVGQIMKRGLLVIHGHVGQTFMYGAKGGKAFVKGNTAGRPLINAVGNPRVVINGTCLDYLAESFMAGHSLQGGGFVIVNGVYEDSKGKICELPSPYPGSNLFSLASGGAIYLRDPEKKISNTQLNGGVFTAFTEQDWDLLEPYLQENETYFGIPLSRLLQWEGKSLPYDQIYRKIVPSPIRALQEEEAWIKVKD